MQIFTRLISAGFKAIFGALATALFFGLLSGGIVLVVAYFDEHNQHWSTIVLTYIVAGVIAVLMAYAAATTVLLRVIAREVVGATKAVTADAEKVATGHS